jgi:hypothetical protein
MLEEVRRSDFSEVKKELPEKLPFRVVPTNILGAFSVVAPADGFDPGTARASELIKHGFLLRRPEEKDDPALHEAWMKMFSRKWLAKDRVVPEMRVHKRKIGFQTNKTFSNQQWAGACIRSGSWQGVVGTWTIPTVSQPPERQVMGLWDSVSWVGLDGGNLGGKFESNDVLQIGIEQTFDGYGAQYSAWYEWFTENDTSPDYVYQVTIDNFPVQAGEEVFASVQYIVESFGYLYMANLSTGLHFLMLLAPPPNATFKGNTVEWIMEVPGGETTNSLPAFTPLVFTGAIACEATGDLGNPLMADVTNIENAQKKKLTSVSLGNYSVMVEFIG